LTAANHRSNVIRMKTPVSSIENQIVQLPHRERARLALALIESLDPGKDEDAADHWLDEAEHRLEKYDQGATDAMDVDEALAEIERQLK
jgi:Putative addiction module component